MSLTLRLRWQLEVRDTQIEEKEEQSKVPLKYVHTSSLTTTVHTIIRGDITDTCTSGPHPPQSIIR